MKSEWTLLMVNFNQGMLTIWDGTDCSGAFLEIGAWNLDWGLVFCFVNNTDFTCLEVKL